MKSLQCILLLLLTAGCGETHEGTVLSALSPKGVYLFVQYDSGNEGIIIRLDADEPEHPLSFTGDMSRVGLAPDGRWTTKLDLNSARVGVVDKDTETGTLIQGCEDPTYMDDLWLTEVGLYTTCAVLFEPGSVLFLDGQPAPQSCPADERVRAVGPQGQVLCDTQILLGASSTIPLSAPLPLGLDVQWNGQDWYGLGTPTDPLQESFDRWSIDLNGVVSMLSPIPAVPVSPAPDGSRQLPLGGWAGFAGHAADGRLYFMTALTRAPGTQQIWSYTPAEATPEHLQAVQSRFQPADYVRVVSAR